MTGEEAEIAEGIDEEMESMGRVEQRAAEFAARRASELAPTHRRTRAGLTGDPVPGQIGFVTRRPGTPGASTGRRQP